MNLIKSEFWRLFINCKDLIIYTTAGNFGNYVEWIIDLKSFLNDTLIPNNKYINKEIKFIIKASHKYEMNNPDKLTGINRNIKYIDTSWISKKWSICHNEIKTEYFIKGWKIYVSETNDGSVYNRKEDCIIIKRVV